MDTSQLKQHRFTEEEYFEELKNAAHKLEYVDGNIRLMAGGSSEHNRVTKNAFRLLDDNPSGCELFLSDTAVSVAKMNRYYFPDLSAVCDANVEEEEGGLQKIKNPCLIVEVLSEGTGEIDRGEKLHAYRQMESFKEYLLIDSRKMQIDYFYRETNDLWHIRSYYKPEQKVEVRTLGVDIPVSAFYEGVEFSEK